MQRIINKLQKDASGDEEAIPEQSGVISTAINSTEPCYDIMVFINEADIVIAGKDNVIRGATTEIKNGCGLQIKSGEILSCLMKPDPMMFPNALKRTGPCEGRAYTLIVTKSSQLTDAGLTQKFSEFTDKLTVHTKQKKCKDLYVLVLLQKAIHHIYAKENEVALNELMTAEELCGNCLNRNLLLGGCVTYKAYIKLYQGKFDEALNYIEKAKYLLANVISGVEKAMLCYLTGYVYMKMAGAEHRPSNQFEDMAIEYFQLHSRHANEDTEREIAIKELQYGILKQATVYLRTYTSNGYKFGTSEQSVEKARELLDFFETNLWQDSTPASRIHFITLRADYLYRRNCLKRALYILTTSGIKLAKEVGHKPMIQMVEDRIKIMKNLIAGKETK